MRVIGLSVIGSNTSKNYVGTNMASRYHFLSSFLGSVTTLGFLAPATCEAASSTSKEENQQLQEKSQNPRYIDSQLQMQYANVGTFLYG
jgi:hypothetical protein